MNITLMKVEAGVNGEFAFVHYLSPHAFLSSLKLPYSGCGDVTLLP